MDIKMYFTYTLVLFIIIVPKNIENTPNHSLRLSSLCPSNAERLVRTPYGFRCLSSKGLTSKRSPLIAELSPLESESSDNYNDKKEYLEVEEEFNTISPNFKPVLVKKYKKVVIKNNRGPWKIDNQIFKTKPTPVSGDAEQLAQYHLTSRTPPNRHVLRKAKLMTEIHENDGILVNQQIVNESHVKVPKLVEGSWMKVPEPSVEPLFPLLSADSLIEPKLVQKLPNSLIEKFGEKKNIKSFQMNSNIEIIDLMEEDSVVNENVSKNSTNALSIDRRMTRSPVLLEKSSYETNGEKLPPIKIYVFLNRNRNPDYKPESSNRYTYAERLPIIPETNSESSDEENTTSSTLTPLKIKRVLKTLNLNEFNEKVGTDEDEEEEGEEEEERDSEATIEKPEVSTTGDIFSLTSVPISRNWNFVCGKKKGFYADMDNDCRTYYQCSVRGRQRFECPPGTRFNQLSSICDWTENVNCLEFKNLIIDKSIEDSEEKSKENPISLLATTTATTTTQTTTPLQEDYEYNSEE